MKKRNTRFLLRAVEAAVEQTEARCGNVRAERDRIQRLVDNLAAVARQVTEERDSLIGECAAVRADYASTSATITRQKQERDDAVKAHESLQHHSSEENRRLREAVAEVNNLRADVVGLLEAKALAEAEIVRVRENLWADVAAARSERDSLRTELAAAQEQVKEWRAKCEPVVEPMPHGTLGHIEWDAGGWAYHPINAGPQYHHHSRGRLLFMQEDLPGVPVCQCPSCRAQAEREAKP